MKLYEIIEGLSESGYFKIKVDLKTRTLRIANTKIISEGKVENHTFTADDIEYTFTGLTDERDLCELYRQYKYSIPGARDGRFRSYFKALPVDKLTDAEMIEAIDRHEAKVKLEAYILLASISGKLTWPDKNKWFMYGHELTGSNTKDEDFVVLRNYIL